MLMHPWNLSTYPYNRCAIGGDASEEGVDQEEELEQPEEPEVPAVKEFPKTSYLSALITVPHPFWKASPGAC
jgi:hypothetical protein